MHNFEEAWDNISLLNWKALNRFTLKYPPAKIILSCLLYRVAKPSIPSGLLSLLWGRWEELLVCQIEQLSISPFADGKEKCPKNGTWSSIQKSLDHFATLVQKAKYIENYWVCNILKVKEG